MFLSIKVVLTLFNDSAPEDQYEPPLGADTMYESAWEDLRGWLPEYGKSEILDERTRIFHDVVDPANFTVNLREWSDDGGWSSGGWSVGMEDYTEATKEAESAMSDYETDFLDEVTEISERQHAGFAADVDEAYRRRVLGFLAVALRKTTAGNGPE